jgi:deoxyadenosine/deoxycytidine kinase
MQKNLFTTLTVSDYLFHRDAIFAHIVLNDEDLDIYKKIYQTFTEKIRKPDLVVYLQTSFAEMLRRIQSNEDDVVRRVPAEFWREIFEAFNYYFFNYKATPLLVVNMERVDVSSPRDLDNLWLEIDKHQAGTRYYAPG